MEVTKKFVTITKEECQNLLNGGSLEILIGKKVRRTLLVGNLYEMRKKQLQEEFEVKMAKLDSEFGSSVDEEDSEPSES